MNAVRTRIAGLALFTACTAESDPEPLQTRTCGQAGPVHLLPLPAGESFTLLGEAAGRWVVRTGTLGDHRAHSVGPCGEEPKAMIDSGELALGEGRVWIVQREAARVGYWPVQGGLVTWIAEGELPIGPVPGRGYIVLERGADTDAFGSAVLVGLDGSRETVWPDVAAQEFDDPMSEEALSAYTYGFQVAGEVFAHLDGAGTLRVAHRDDPGSPQTVDAVASFALGPDGSWFVTREDDGVSPQIDDVSAATFHVRGTVEPVALGRAEAWPEVVHPSGWLQIRTGDGPASAIFVADTRVQLEIPGGFSGQPRTDDAGRLYSEVDGSILRWDPFTNTTESKADVPGDFGIRLINDRAAVSVRGSGPGGLSFSDAEVTVVPFDGADAWTVPGLVDSVRLLPDGSVIYAPDVGDGDDVDVAPLHWIDRGRDPMEIDPAVPITGLTSDTLEGDLVYRVEDGDRSGVWRAALP